MLGEKIQEWIDGEEKARRTKPNIYCGDYLEYSHGWSAGLEFARDHDEQTVRSKFIAMSNVNELCSDHYRIGYYNALRDVLKGDIK